MSFFSGFFNEYPYHPPKSVYVKCENSSAFPVLPLWFDIRIMNFFADEGKYKPAICGKITKLSQKQKG